MLDLPLLPTATGFAARASALELLELHVVDRLQYLGERGLLSEELQAVNEQAAKLRVRLERANERVLSRFRNRIRTGRYTPDGLGRAFARCAGTVRSDGRYDTLDLLVAGLLIEGAPSEERAIREPEMVGYQPTPARDILALIARADIRPDDVMLDLGSGLGQVAILVALLTGARARGIELEPAYAEYAMTCARKLNVSRVDFVEADAREASLADGTVFFMYTPFRGALLQQVLARLHGEASQRPIRVCTYGPCTAEIARASWLRPAEGGTLEEHEVAVFHGGP